jgi:hypothetical protein
MGLSLKFRQGLIAQEGAQRAVRARFTPAKVPIGQALVAEGVIVFAKACEVGLEGVVSKREGSFYKSGKSRNWLKTVNPGFVRTRPAARLP